MRYRLRYTFLLLGIGATLAIGWPVGAQGLKQQAIGLYMAIIGKVTVAHVGQPVAVPVKLREDVYFKDVIETQASSRAKALFQDDSILTVGKTAVWRSVSTSTIRPITSGARYCGCSRARRGRWWASSLRGGGPSSRYTHPPPWPRRGARILWCGLKRRPARRWA